MEDAGRSGPRDPGGPVRRGLTLEAGRSLLVTRDAEICRWDEMEIRQLYGRVLTRWATDMMELRRRGLDVPGGRRRADSRARSGGGSKVRRRRIGMDA